VSDRIPGVEVSVVVTEEIQRPVTVALVGRLGFVLVTTTRDADHFKGSTSDERLYVLDFYGG
jgi:hypothetical protein